MEASRSTILFLFLNVINRIIGAMNPNVSDVKMVISLCVNSVSSVIANNVKTIMVKEGGTNRVEINLANLSEFVFNQTANWISFNSSRYFKRISSTAINSTNFINSFLTFEALYNPFR